MPQHSANEQYLLELINAERAKAGVQPLAFDDDLSEAAEGHSQWMLTTDTFSHAGSGGSTPTERMQAAGYSLEGSWKTGENIAWATTRPPSGYADEVLLLHNNLMNSPGHRANILNGNFREVGLGLEVGDYRGRSSTFLTENFGKSGSDHFLTGVAFDDQDGDKFYDPGEGLSEIAITATNSNGDTFTTTSTAAGGYDLALKPGTYTVTFSGEGIETSTSTVSIGSQNVKLDLVDPEAEQVVAAPEEPIGETPAPQPQPELPDPEREPAPAPEPAPDSPPPSVNEWLAKFFGGAGGNVWFRQTLAEHDADQGTRSVGSELDSTVAFNGDAIVFASLSESLADIGEIVEQAGDEAQAAVQAATNRGATVDWSNFSEGPWGDGDSLAAKLLEQISTHNSLMTADQAA